MDEQKQGFHGQESTGSHATRYIIGIAIACILIPLLRGQIPFIRQHPPMSAEEIGRALEQDSDTGTAFLAFRDYYPDDYRAFLQRSVGPLNREDAAAANQAGVDFMQRFLHNRLPAIAATPSDRLHVLAQEYSALLHVLKQTDAGLCARFVTTGLASGEHPARQAVRQLARISALEFAAANAGRESPTPRPAALPEADRRAWMAAVSDIDPDVPALLTDPDGLRNSTMELQCNAGAALYDAAAELPEEQSANVTAHLLRLTMGG